MRLLLDTHVLLWWMSDDRRLGPAARDSIGDPASDVYVSAASIWEIAIKAVIGKLEWRDGPSTTLVTCIGDCGFSELPVTAAHAASVRELPSHHADPFDRLLLAQAATEGIRFVSADDTLRRYRSDILDATT